MYRYSGFEIPTLMSGHFLYYVWTTLWQWSVVGWRGREGGREAGREGNIGSKPVPRLTAAASPPSGIRVRPRP